MVLNVYPDLTGTKYIAQWAFKKEVDVYCVEHNLDINIDVLWNEDIHNKIVELDRFANDEYIRALQDFEDDVLKSEQFKERKRNIISDRYHKIFDVLYEYSPPYVEMEMDDFTIMVMSL